MTLSPGDDVLDEAYERLFAYGPEFEGYLSNHGPMVVEVLERNRLARSLHEATRARSVAKLDDRAGRVARGAR